MKTLTEKIKQTRALVIGDLMLDIYLRGKANRISPEAPVLVVAAEKKQLLPGGAANVAVSLRELGCTVRLSGFVGNDWEGDLLVSSLSERGIATDTIVQCGEPTISKTRVLANGQHVVRYDIDSNFSCVKERESILESVSSAEDFDIVVVSDYNKGTICHKLMDLIRARFRCPVVCDIKPANRSMFHGVYCIAPNLVEAKQMAGSDDKSAPLDIAIELKRKMELESIIITLADEGLLFVGEDDQSCFLEAYTKFDEHDPMGRLDVTGAGDTVLGTFAACLGANIESKYAVFAANVAAGIVVRKTGTATCTFDELTSELGKENHDGFTTSIQQSP